MITFKKFVLSKKLLKELLESLKKEGESKRKDILLKLFTLSRLRTSINEKLEDNKFI